MCFMKYSLLLLMVAVNNSRYKYHDYTGELGYDKLNGTMKIGLSYAKSVVYI